MQLQSHQSQTLFPRVLGNRLPHNNTSITIVGMITHLDESQRKLTLQVDPSTKQTVDIIISNIQPSELRQLKFIQVRGFSNQDGQVEMKDYTNFLDNFDLKTYNQVIKLTSESAFKTIFGY